MTATERFQQLVNDKVRRGLSRREAVAMTVRKNPNLHREYLAEQNSPRVRRQHGLPRS